MSPSQLQSTEGTFGAPDDKGPLSLNPEMTNNFIILLDEEKLDDRAKMSVAAKRSLFRVHVLLMYT